MGRNPIIKGVDRVIAEFAITGLRVQVGVSIRVCDSSGESCVTDDKQYSLTGEKVLLPEKLTPREIETLRLIAQGMSNQEIASTLCVTNRTVAKYVSKVLHKLCVPNRTRAALYAVKEGLTDS